MSERFVPSIGLLASLENIPLLCHFFFFSVFHPHFFSLAGAPPQGIQWETSFAIRGRFLILTKAIWIS